MMTGSAGQIRHLGRIETAIAASSERWPLNMVAVLRLAPAPDAELLRTALAQAQYRHPALRARIEKRGRRYTFAYDGVPPVRLEVVGRAQSDSWIAVAEDLLNTPLPASVGPLASGVLLRAGDGHAGELVLCFHHAIVDAASGSELLRGLLTAYGSLAQGPPLPPGAPLEVPPAADALFPRSCQGVRLRARRAEFVARQMPREARYRRAMRRANAPVVRPEGRTQVLPSVLDADATTHLGRSARQRRLTLVSVLQAALLSTVHRHRYDARPALLRTMTFADLRPHLIPPVPVEPLACYMAMTSQDVPMEDGADLWSIAREVQDRVEASVRGCARFVASSMSLPLMRMALATKKLRVGNTALSHTGATPLDVMAGPLEVRGLHAFISNLAVGPEFSLRAGAFDGCLTLDAMALDTDMSRGEMQRIADGILVDLREAAGS